MYTLAPAGPTLPGDPGSPYSKKIYMNNSCTVLIDFIAISVVCSFTMKIINIEHSSWVKILVETLCFDQFSVDIFFEWQFLTLLHREQLTH